MPQESFLVNPLYKRHRARRRNPLPGSLLGRMIKQYGPRTGMKKAWEAYRKGTTHNYNPMGEEVILVGNPRIRRRRVAGRNDPVRRRRRRLVRLNDPARRRRRRVARRNEPARRRTVRRRRLVANPRRGYRRYRRFSRNEPVTAISIMRPTTLIPTLAVGGLSAALTIGAPGLVARFIPTMAGSPIVNWGSRVVVAVGGGWVVGKFVGKQYGTIWTVVGIATIGGMLVADYLLKPMGLLGAYPLGDEYEYLSQGEELLPSREEEGVPLGDVGAYYPEEGII